MADMLAPSEGRLHLLDTLVADSTLRVELVKADFTNDESLTYASLTLADFSGYVYQVPSFGAGIINGDGNAESTAGTLTWTHDGGGTANTIYGVVISALTLSASREILLANKFDSPVVMGSLGASIARSFNMLIGQFSA